MRSKRPILTILILCILLILAGCRVVAFEGLKEEGTKRQEEAKHSVVMVDFAPTLVLLGPQIIVRGEVSLPAGTVVTVQIKPFSDQDDYLSIVNEHAKPLDEVLMEGEIAVDENGEFGPVVFKREVPNPDKRFRIEAIIDPRVQSQDVQELLGSAGENIADSSGMVSLTEGDKEVVLIRKYTDVMTDDEGGSGTLDPIPFISEEHEGGISSDGP